jgi:NAD(P)-dependent dehydrogenase (short-subunit alcohol dehydrogenase family)
MAQDMRATIPPDGRVIMISGANRGIGLAIARRLHADGYGVSLGARDLAALEAATAEFGNERVLRCRFEARDRAMAGAWVAETVARLGRLDGLVNNAGVLLDFPYDEPDEDLLDEMWEVHVKAPYRLIVAALPHLRACGEGRIVNIVSNSGLRYKGGVPGYCLTKFAAMGLTNMMRHQTWGDGIRVTGLCPGVTLTDMGRVTPGADVTTPGSLAVIVGMLISLPNNAGVAALPVNYAFEPTV